MSVSASIAGRTVLFLRGAVKRQRAMVFASARDRPISNRARPVMVRTGRSTPLSPDGVGRGLREYLARNSSIRRSGAYWAVLDPILELPVAFDRNERGGGIILRKQIFSTFLTEPQIFATLPPQESTHHFPVAAISESGRLARSLTSQRRESTLGSVAPVPEQSPRASLSGYPRDQIFRTYQSTVNHFSSYNALSHLSIFDVIRY